MYFNVHIYFTCIFSNFYPSWSSQNSPKDLRWDPLPGLECLVNIHLLRVSWHASPPGRWTLHLHVGKLQFQQNFSTVPVCLYQSNWDWHGSQYNLSALEVRVLPAVGIREKDMKKGHEVLKNPISRQLGVGSWGSPWLKGNWVSECFGHSEPHRLQPTFLGWERRVMFNQINPLTCSPRRALEARRGNIPCALLCRSPRESFPQHVHQNYKDTSAIIESAGKGYLSFILCAYFFLF